MKASAGELQVIFLRHGESRSNLENRVQGHSDSGLTARGLRQAQKAATRLARVGIRKIYSSDLGRAMQTSSVVAKKTGRRVIPDPAWREISLGAWEGLSTDEINQKFRRGYDRWLLSPSRIAIPGAERVREFHSRVQARVKKLFLNETDGPVLVVTHGGVIASLLSLWLDSCFDKTLLNLRIDNTSITWVEKNSQRIKIHTLNDITHLSQRDLSHKNIFTER